MTEKNKIARRPGEKGFSIIILVVGMITAFIISFLTVKYLLKYVKKHDFKIFGWYRIVLGLIIIIYFIIK